MNDISSIIASIKYEQTELCSIMNKYGSDKGNGWHNYSIIYFELFNHLRYKNINIFKPVSKKYC